MNSSVPQAMKPNKVAFQLTISCLLSGFVFFKCRKIYMTAKRNTVDDDVGMNTWDDIDPTYQVIESCCAVMEEAKSVEICQTAMKSMANQLKDKIAADKIVQWDEMGWHWNEDVQSGGELTCQYIFVLDSLNFCFWPTTGMEYEQLARALTAVLKADPTAFDAERLLRLTEDELRDWFPGLDLPQAGARAGALRELGAVLLARGYGGRALNLVRECRGSAVRLVRALTALLPAFRDATVWRGRQVHFYKRAQILAADLWGAFGRRRRAAGGGAGGNAHPCAFADAHRLTMFADYRVPQILREHGVLVYAAPLAARVDGGAELPPGSPEEVEIRAATVVAVQQIQQHMVAEAMIVEDKTSGEKSGVTAVEVDWLLWQMGEEVKDEIKPHHRTLTIFY